MSGKHDSNLPDVTLDAERPETLRDRFAMAALSGMHARDTFDEGLSTPQQRARVAFLDADAMIAERAK